MSSPYSASGNNGISVADAKAYIASIDSDAIQDQITHYANAAASLNTLAVAVMKINVNLQATWNGAAATAANAKFKAMASRASDMASTLTEQVIPVLAAAYSGAQKAQSAIDDVQDEITSVTISENPIGSLNTGFQLNRSIIYPAVTSQVAMPPENLNSSMTRFQAENFNAQQRKAAADAINAVAGPYNASASSLTILAGGLQDTSNVSTATTSAAGFTFVSPDTWAGSNGAASGYHANFGNRGGSASVGKPSSLTTVEGFVPPPRGGSPSMPPADVPSVSPPVALTSVGVLAHSVVLPPGGDPAEPGVGGGSGSLPPGVFGERGLPSVVGGGSVSVEGGSGEGGLVGGFGSGIIPGSTSFETPHASGAAGGVVGGPPEIGDTASSLSQGYEKFPPAMMGGGLQGGGAGGVGEDESSGPSPAYLRGRYLGGKGGASDTPTRWEMPAIGGSEGVLIGVHPSATAGVTSVYIDAQDGQGNPLGMMGGSGFGEIVAAVKSVKMLGGGPTM